jgi:hypothetical protein
LCHKLGSCVSHIKLKRLQFARLSARNDVASMELRTQYLLLLFVFGVIAKGMVKVRPADPVS